MSNQQIILPDPFLLLDEIMTHWKSHYEAALDNKHSEEAHTPNLEMWLQFDATRPHDDCFVLEFDGNMSGIGRIVTLNLTNNPYADHAERYALDQCVTPMLASIREFATAEGLDWVAFEDATPVLPAANAAGFTRHDFGGNTIWLVRREPSRVLAITAVDDSFPPRTLGEESDIVAYAVADFAEWEAGERDLQDVNVLGEHRGTAKECIGWYANNTHPCPKCGNPTDPSNFDPINSRWCFNCVDDFPVYRDIRDIPNPDKGGVHMSLPYEDRQKIGTHIFEVEYPQFGRRVELRLHPEADTMGILVWDLRSRYAIPDSLECETLQEARYTARRMATRPRTRT